MKLRENMRKKYDFFSRHFFGFKVILNLTNNN